MATFSNDLEEILKKTQTKNELDDKAHPWRVCPIGKHLVKKHIVHVPPSKKNPTGETVERQEHCALNPSKKDILSFDEIQIITEKYFHKLSGPPKINVLKGYANADKFDVEIRGWTRYWNDIFSLPDPLEANLVKALIASESIFHPETDIPARKHGRARGLMQITDSTMTALSDHHGELSNYLICFEHLKLLNPTANICCGVRWLFRKRITASAKLGRQATWIEAVADYKGILKNLPHQWMEIFQHHYLCIIEGC